MYDGLPDACLTLKPSDSSLIYSNAASKAITHPIGIQVTPLKTAKSQIITTNSVGLTARKEEAVLNGSIFGWDVPAADPKHFENLPPPEVNAGYTIIKRETIGKIEIVLGESITGAGLYVTWRRTPGHEHNGRTEYYWGHYFNSKIRAEDDFNARVREEKLLSKENMEERSKAPKRNDPER